MKMKYNVPGIIACIMMMLLLLFFPFANPCQSEDGYACTWRAESHGNGLGNSFTNFYGVNLYVYP